MPSSPATMGFGFGCLLSWPRPPAEGFPPLGVGAASVWGEDRRSFKRSSRSIGAEARGRLGASVAFAGPGLGFIPADADDLGSAPPTPLSTPPSTSTGFFFVREVVFVPFACVVLWLAG